MIRGISKGLDSALTGTENAGFKANDAAPCTNNGATKNPNSKLKSEKDIPLTDFGITKPEISKYPILQADEQDQVGKSDAIEKLSKNPNCILISGEDIPNSNVKTVVLAKNPFLKANEAVKIMGI